VSDLQKAYELEELQYSRLINEANRDEEHQIAAFKAQMGTRGTLLSGGTVKGIIQIRAEKAKRLIDERIKIRKTLVAEFPELGSEKSLAELMTRLDESVRNAFVGAIELLPPTLRSVSTHVADRERYRLSIAVRTEIEILKREIVLNLHLSKPEAPAVSVTTTGSGSIVNLGTIHGNVQQAINNVQQHGYQELAGRLEQLARAINDSQELGGEKRKLYLEQVEFIAEQTAKSEETRIKTGSAVAGIFCGLQATLQTVANAAQILAVLGPELAKHFSLPWPF
jgi:hypothetical protein